MGVSQQLMQERSVCWIDSSELYPRVNLTEERKGANQEDGKEECNEFPVEYSFIIHSLLGLLLQSVLEDGLFEGIMHQNGSTIYDIRLQSMHQEIQVAPGVYITDFRKDKPLLGLNEEPSQKQDHPLLILDHLQAMDKQIDMLEATILQIKQENQWENDGDFREAVEDNWSVIIRVSSKMREHVLRLFQLQYHPENAKIENLLNVDRIQTRQLHAKKELEAILQARQSQEGVYV